MSKKEKQISLTPTSGDVLASIVSDLNEEHESEVASVASDKIDSDVTFRISTGSTSVDTLLRGGVPVGRIIELYGREGSGKTTLLTHLFINCQKAGGVPILIDSERSFFKKRAERMGLDLSGLLTLRPESLEEGFKLITDIVNKLRASKAYEDKKFPIVIGWDSIAVAQPKDLLSFYKDETDKAFAGGMMQKARIIRASLSFLTPIISNEQVLIVLLNHLIEGPKGETTPGGGSVGYLSSQRIRLGKIRELEDSRGFYGTVSAVKIHKNKVDSDDGSFILSDNEALIVIDREKGIDDDRSMVEFLVKPPQGMTAPEEVRLSGAWYKWKFNGKEFSSHGQDITEKLDENPGLRERLKELVTERLKG